MRRLALQNVYAPLCLSMCLIFALVGLLFLALPGAAVELFNALSRPLGMLEAPMQDAGLYVALAAGYMYVVSLLAYRMFRQPGARIFPVLLAHAKGASAVISILLFAAFRPYLILLANGIIDGAIAVFVLLLLRAMREQQS